MRDRDIRIQLRRRLEEEHTDGALIIDELGLCQGEARIDMAVVNGAINGFEIKSERDTLERLPGQIEVYNRTLDTVTIVAGGRHLAHVEAQIPEWWGLFAAAPTKDGPTFDTVRAPKQNPNVDYYARAQLLWRDETWEALCELGLGAGLASKPRRHLWAKLVEALPGEEVSRIVRQKLSARANWRAD